jgi:hypothetical protein
MELLAVESKAFKLDPGQSPKLGLEIPVCGLII